MKRLYFLTMIITMVITGCTQGKTNKEMLEAFNSRIALEAQNKAIAEKIIDGLNQRDTTYIELYSPDCKYYFPSANPTPTSRMNDLESSKNYWIRVPDLKMKIEEIVAEGNLVTARFTASGTPEREWFGAPPSGKRFETGGIFIIRIDNGKIVEQREDVDLLGMLQQIGMELTPTSKSK